MRIIITDEVEESDEELDFQSLTHTEPEEETCATAHCHSCGSHEDLTQLCKGVSLCPDCAVDCDERVIYEKAS